MNIPPPPPGWAFAPVAPAEAPNPEIRNSGLVFPDPAAEDTIVRQPVRSSNIASIGWAANVLEVEYRNSGAVWRYEGVGPTVWTDLLRAPSVGAFVAQRIKNVYPGQQVG